jgi:hypothetical protein
MDDKIKDAIAALDAEEQTLLDVVKSAETRLGKVRGARASLMALTDQEPLADFDGGLAEACRVVLKNNAGRSLAPVEVRDRLADLGYPLHHHNNAMASIHSVLKRLKESGDVETKTGKDGGTRYRWIQPEVRRLPIVNVPALSPMVADQLIAVADSFKTIRDSVPPAQFAEITRQANDAMQTLHGTGILKTLESIGKQLPQQFGADVKKKP